MLKNWKKKLIAVLLIFVLTFSNFAIVGKAYAASILDGIFSNDEDAGDTGSANVEFDAYFIDVEGKKETSIKSDVNNKDLLVGASINVKNNGYLKDAKIILGNGEELNFNILANYDELDENIQTFENNELALVQLNAGSELEFKFPIEYANSKFVNSSKISKINQIKFEGIYVNENAEEIAVTKTVDLALSWKDSREVRLDSEVTKFIGYTSDGKSGIILQTSISVDNETENSSLPVKNSTLKVEVPMLNDVKANSINVVATSTEGTNGKKNDEVVFSTDNWSYDEETNMLTINIENEKELVSTQNENEILIDETAVDELYYSASGKDTYLITYTYNDVSISELNFKSNVSEEYTLFGDDNKLSNNTEFNYEVSDTIGDIVTYKVESSTDSVSKGYTYLNYNNEENKYEVEIDNKLVFNISYKDIVDALYYEDAGSQYVTKNGDILPQNDIYYKSLVISDENFKSILGEDGFIKLYSESGEEIFTINKDTPKTDVNNIELNIDSSVKYLRIETSKPIADGNLIIKTIKAYSTVSFDKEQFKNFDKLTNNTIGKAKYIYLNDLADCGLSTTEVKLEDTRTSAELEVGQTNLSTLAMNSNVELKIELNNQDVKSDIYGDSEFTIKMPDYVQTVDVTSANIVYGEGLELSAVNAYEENGDIFLKVKTRGNQNELSNGIISKGTNIVLNTNIKVDLYAPASNDQFELTYSNSEATTYENEKDGLGYDNTEITYSAPSGVVTVNSITGFNDSLETVTSIKQGKQVGKLPIYSDRREASMELTVMNNEKTAISNVRMLGRTPFQGVKDIITGEELGTTTTGKMLSGLVADQDNRADFTIYYSENGEATDELENPDNGWTQNVSDFETIKSYLIVPNDANYQMEPETKIRFTYTYEIPENLEHNVDMYGTFATYYTHTTDIATLNEISIADLVGLSTGVGPQFDITTTTNATTVNEFAELEITTVLKNTGKIDAKNVVVEVPLPKYTSLSNKSVAPENVSMYEQDSKVIYRLDTLEAGKEITFKTYVTIDEIIYDNAEDSDNTVDEDVDHDHDDEKDHEEDYEPIINEIPEVIETEVYATVTADELDAVLKTEPVIVKILKAEIKITMASEDMNSVLTKDSVIKLNIRIKNLKDEDLKNTIVTMKLDDAFEFQKAYVAEFDESGVMQVEGASGKYDEATRTVTWNIDSIRSLYIKTVCLEMKVKLLDENITKKDIFASATVKADGTKEYEAQALKITVGKPVLVITQTTDTVDTYIKEGTEVTYKFSIKNEGTVTAKSVTLTDKIPDGLVAKSINYVKDGIVVNKQVSQRDEVRIGTSIGPGQTLDVNIKTVATSLNGAKERSVTNAGTVNATDIDDITSNKITHIVEPSIPVIEDQVSNGLASSSITNSSNNNLSKTYKITGLAWLDSNNNGMRDLDEKLLKGIKATLVDTDNGVIKQSTVTNSNGEYSFAGVENGNYIIIFDYDTVLYTVTTYQKENVLANVNSDVITTKVEQDGKLRNGAVTGTITVADGSISNIDIGLIEAMKFDLSLNMGISKITVQNSSGTKTTKYNNDTLTKTEIGAKQMNGSLVYIEYNLTVKNEGEVAGFAKKIVDNLPEGMDFNSGMNADWYSGTDGKLYTSALSDIEIQPGETKTLKLVLSRTMTNENTGMVTNTAEIAEDYNIYGISDSDSVPNNNSQSEDDFARADALLSVRTGEVFVYISVIITTILLIGIAVFIIVLKTKYKVSKGGV